MHHFFISFLLTSILMSFQMAQAQMAPKSKTINKDSLLKEKERKKTVKILHAEPLYVDLIRDLGARKGEKEWNVGLGVNENKHSDEYEALVEYEFAPLNRLGVEFEVPFSRIHAIEGSGGSSYSQINSLKVATQYSFFVSEKYNTTMAIGYLHEFEMNAFNLWTDRTVFKGNIFNPFFIAAKRWGHSFHTLIYTGPSFVKNYNSSGMQTQWQVNTNFHYMIPGTKNFVGVEFNKTFVPGNSELIIRPQMRVSVTDQIIVGIVTGIPITSKNQRFSSFLRLIYEPKHKS